MTQGAVEVIASEFLAARSATSVCRLPPWRALCRRAPLLERPPERILRMSGPGQVENLCLSGSCIHKASYSGNGQGLLYQERKLHRAPRMSVSRPSTTSRREWASSEINTTFGPGEVLDAQAEIELLCQSINPVFAYRPSSWHAAQHGPTKGRYGWRVDVVLRTTRNRQIAFSLQRSRRGKL